MTRFRLAVLPGDGIGPEVVAEAVKVLRAIETTAEHRFELTEDVVGGAAIDAYGTPIRKENLPRTAFEKAAVAQINQGEPYYDEVGTDNAGKPVLRAATIVPVVMKQCINCHPGLKEGELMGAIVYELPIK